jgi:hypothetical protein
MVYYFNPILPTKEAFDSRIFPLCHSSLRTVVQHLTEYSNKRRRVRGQLVLLETNTKKYIDFNGVLYLKEELSAIEYNESIVDTIWIYDVGYFTK